MLVFTVLLTIRKTSSRVVWEMEYIVLDHTSDVAVPSERHTQSPYAWRVWASR